MKRFIVSLILSAFLLSATAQDSGSNSNASQDNWFLKNYTATDKRYATEQSPEMSEEEIINRLQALPVVIDMPYNAVVKDFIDKYTIRERGTVPVLLGVGLYYNPIFEQALEEQGLPLELRYLPMIESTLNPNAVSKHGAAGLWQFTLATAKGLGMEVNSLIDERRDPYISSEMAASYLKGLYDTYGDWSLAIAAYNCGPGNLNKAIDRAGGDPSSHDFWCLYNFLPAETRNYFPMFIAMNYVMEYYPDHNISPVLRTAPLVMDTVHVSDRIHFDQISEVLDIPIDVLRQLNPQYRADIIPGSPDMPRNLILPSQQIHAYLMSESDIKNYAADKYNSREQVNVNSEDVAEEIVAVEETEIWATPVNNNSGVNTVSSVEKHTIIHKVKAGETLASIAALYEVTPEEIKATNNLRRNAVRVGQQLRINSSAPQAMMETTVAAVTNQKNSTTQKNESTKTPAPKKASSTPSTHKVRKGETLSSIAKKYGVTIAAIKQANGMTSDNLKAGATIKIPAKGSAGTAKKSSATSKKTSRR